MPEIHDCDDGPSAQDPPDNIVPSEANKNKGTSSSGDSQNENKKSDMLTKSVITSVVTVDAIPGGSDRKVEKAEESAETSSGDQQLRLSKIEQMIDDQQHQLQEGAQVQHSVRMLRQIQAELKSHVQALMQQ